MLSYGSSHSDATVNINALLELCDNLNIDTIAGPVLSGSVIAVSCFIMSADRHNKINAMLLGKKEYKKTRYLDGISILGSYYYINRILLADDCVDSGNTLVYALKEIADAGYTKKLVGCVSRIFTPSSITRITTLYPNMRFFEMFHGGKELLPTRTYFPSTILDNNLV